MFLHSPYVQETKTQSNLHVLMYWDRTISHLQTCFCVTFQRLGDILRSFLQLAAIRSGKQRPDAFLEAHSGTRRRGARPEQHKSIYHSKLQLYPVLWKVKTTTLEVSRVIQPFYLNPYPTAFPYGNGMVLNFYQQQESSMTKTVHKVINKGLKAYV